MIISKEKTYFFKFLQKKQCTLNASFPDKTYISARNSHSILLSYFACMWLCFHIFKGSMLTWEQIIDVSANDFFLMDWT